MTSAVKRACDACHRRKVKCDGINPCRNCNTASLNCTYNAVPQKKGPKGSRAKVISALREDQKQQSLSAQVQNRLNGIAGPPVAASLTPTAGLLTGEMARECLDFFFTNMYPHMPILNRQRLEQQAPYMDQSLDTYCLLTSLCALMMLQPGMGIPGGDPFGLDNMPGANIVSSTVLMEETTRVRKSFDYTESPSLNTLATSYFLFACYYGLDMHEKAWFHLREATTLMHIVGMNTEEFYAPLEPVESSRRRRLYWLLFVTERSYALQRNKPLTLQATIKLPTVNDDATDVHAHRLDSFLRLVNLFRPFDDAFVSNWSKTRGNLPAPHLQTLQKQLADILPSFLSYGDSQLADIRSNQQWIKTMNWQLTMTSGNVNSNPDESLVYQQYAANLRNSLLSGSELAATPLLTQVLDVACDLTDVLSIYPASRDPFSPGPKEQLNPLLNVLSMLRNGDHRFMPLLISKMHEVLPKLASPMLLNVPDSVVNNACNVDIFDGFGNAGMAQSPAMRDSFDKYSSPESSGSQNGAPSTTTNNNNDMHSPFVSSPMSSASDFSHGIPNNTFNAMSDVMMSQMTQPPVSQTLQIPTTNPPPTPHSQHAPHTPITSMPNLNQHMQNNLHTPLQQTANLAINHQNQAYGQGFPQNIPFSMNGLGQDMNANNMMQRQPPTRSNSFAVGPNPQLRTIGDFQALQRANSDMATLGSLGMGNQMQMGTELDFSGLS